jgi:N-acyl-D-aspartate/D-glutamate deacylase
MSHLNGAGRVTSKDFGVALNKRRDRFALALCVMRLRAIAASMQKTMLQSPILRQIIPAVVLLFPAVVAEPAHQRGGKGLQNDSQGTALDGVLGREHPHPRAYGTFPRILRKYLREEHKLSLADAIRKFSALPAQRMRLIDRGVLKQGMWADIVVFDPETIHDAADFEHPNQLSVGMQHVLVNGIPVIENGKMTNALPGRVLRGPAYQPASPHDRL